MTEGRRALLAVLQRTRALEVAARCRVAPSRVSEWASGRCRPSERARRVLLDVYHIPVGLWESDAGERRR